jgi:hypothetical protein
MFNKDQIKKLSDTFSVIAYAQFGVFGYDAYQQSQWLMLSVSSVVFIELQVFAIMILGLGDKHE